MIRLVGYLLLLFCALIFETTLLQVPLVLTILIVAVVLEKRAWILLVGFLAGLILDSLTFRLLGSNSLFFTVSLGILFLYGKKFETHHVGFGAFFVALCSIIYGFVFGIPQPFLAAFLAVVIGTILLLTAQILASKPSLKIGL